MSTNTTTTYFNQLKQPLLQATQIIMSNINITITVVTIAVTAFARRKSCYATIVTDAFVFLLFEVQVFRPGGEGKRSTGFPGGGTRKHRFLEYKFFRNFRGGGNLYDLLYSPCFFVVRFVWGGVKNSVLPTQNLYEYRFLWYILFSLGGHGWWGCYPPLPIEKSSMNEGT